MDGLLSATIEDACLISAMTKQMCEELNYFNNVCSHVNLNGQLHSEAATRSPGSCSPLKVCFLWLTEEISFRMKV